MLEEKSASLAQRHLNIVMIEFSNSLTEQQRLHQSLILGGHQMFAKYSKNFTSTSKNIFSKKL